MPKFLDKLNRKLSAINEDMNSGSLKDPNSPEYDRQYAEDMLYHTIGPLTDSPRWVNEEWSSQSDVPADFVKGGPAPKWTEEEIALAYAGDPNLLYGQTNGNPRSPKYGDKGGSPMYRLARNIAKKYSRTDFSFISDLYSNGFIALMRIMQPGADKQLAGFISFASRNVKNAMEHGIGGENRVSAAAGKVNESGHIGIAGILELTNPSKIREAASVVKGKFREQASHEKSEDNPFGKLSPDYYKAVMNYADAIESNDDSAIRTAKMGLVELNEKVDEYNTKIGGASTGLGQAIDTPDRKTRIGVQSVDAPTADGGQNQASKELSSKVEDSDDSSIDHGMINYILEIAINHNLGEILAKSEKYTKLAIDMGSKDGKIGGPMGANELRFIIRTLGPLGTQYPGKGNPRANRKIPRDARGWWSPGEDPEIEQLEGGGMWKSIWSRNGYQSMGTTAIAIEMTEEVAEFEKYGIQTARSIKSKNNGKSEAISKVAVNTTINNARIKLKIIADIYSDELGINESRELVGDTTTVDRILISEAANYLYNKLTRVMRNASYLTFK